MPAPIPTENRTAAEPGPASAPEHPAWIPVLLAAAAGGLGWGIRGQYGHESGAMIAGVLVGLALALVFARHLPLLTTARAVAWFVVAIGFGGSETYGQTIGLTKDAPLIGQWAPLAWGMLGLAIKGGLWIGFAGLLLGMGLGGVRYRPLELTALSVGMIGLFYLGVALLNSPYDPGQRQLPALYFSADWRWLPQAELKPRREVWGGLLLALAGATTYAGAWRRDRLAWRMALWATLAGAVGFPAGESLQAFHAWNQDWFRTSWMSSLDPHLNWWNLMETTFGAVFGAIVGFGLWRHRRMIAAPAPSHPVSLSPAVEGFLVGIHVALLVSGEFFDRLPFGFYTEVGLMMGVIPLAAIAGGRWWPFLLTLPVTLIPIAGKTIRQLVDEEATVGPVVGWGVYGVIPCAAAIALAFVEGRRAAAPSGEAATADRFVRRSLLFATVLYFGLNFAFFRFPWPWQPWTIRTPNALVFTACVVVLVIAAIRLDPKPQPGLATTARSR